MGEPGNRLANLFLRYASPFAELRRVPSSAISSVGPAASFSPRYPRLDSDSARPAEKPLDTRQSAHGQNVQRGIGEPQVQQALVDHLRPGMTFYDLGANIGYFSLIAARLVGPKDAWLRLRRILRLRHACAKISRAIISRTRGLNRKRFGRKPRPCPLREWTRTLRRTAVWAMCPPILRATPSKVEAVSLDRYVTAQNSPDFCEV